MKMIRMAVVVAAASAAASKAKQYAHENPDQASQFIARAESFLSDKAGPRYADKVGKGGAALRSGLGLSSRSAPATPSTTSTPSTPSAPSAGEAPTATTGFDPSI